MTLDELRNSADMLLDGYDHPLVVCLSITHITNTRIMVYKGMVYKGKYSISEKNKGIQVSIFG